jgi:hypothetical protein
MFCPKCKAQYRPGFSRCADCGIDLVDALPGASAGDVQQSHLDSPRTIWIGDSETDCVAQCTELKEAGIPYAVVQRVKEKRQRMQVSWKYELAVSAEHERRAKDLLQLPEKVVEWDSDNPEEPDEEEALPDAGVVEPDLDEARRRRSYLKYFDSDNACVEISEAGSLGIDVVKSCLKENYIRVRVESQADGSQKLFVLPEDEPAAREIVREMLGDSAYPET